MKELRRFFFFVCLFVLLERPCHYATHGFNVTRIQIPLKYDPQFASKTVDIPSAFNQPFSLLNSGAQIYAFESADKAYVLKLFKFHHLRINPLLAKLHPNRKKIARKSAKREKRRLELFQSFWIAMNDLQEETGLISLHLNPSDSPLFVSLIDKNGIAHKIDLSKTAFALQKKATLAYSHLKEASVRGEGKIAIHSLIQLVEKRCKLGIFDKDPDFMTNFGFIDKEAVEIDVGRFSYDPREKERHHYRGEIYRITRDLRRWLQINCPELVNTLDEEVMRI